MDSWRAPVEEQLAAAQEDVKGGERRSRPRVTHVESLERSEAGGGGCATAREQAEAAADDEQRREAEEQAVRALKRFWGQLPKALAGQSGTDLVDAIRQARAELERGKALAAYWKDWRHVAS